MNSFEVQAFRSMVNAASAEEASALSLKAPVVLSESLWPEFREWATHQPPEIRYRAEGVMTMLSSLLRETIEHWHRYPFGIGPLDTILQRVMAGEIDEQQAAVMAATPEVVRNLSPAYVRARMMQGVLQAMNGDWRNPLLCHRAILAAVAARKSMFTRDQKAMESIAAIEYANVAKEAIWATADGRILRDAVERLRAVADYDPRPWGTPGATEYALGQLHLDPYIHKRSTDTFKWDIVDWMRRSADSKGAPLPQPLDAFAEASRHFLASANLNTGSDRGLSLKGYIEAEVWKKVAGGTAAELSGPAAEARKLLAGDIYDMDRAAIDTLLQYAESEPVSDWRQTASDLVAKDLADMLKRRGLVQTTEFMIRVAEAVRHEDRGLALAVWRKALPLMLSRDETSIDSFLRSGLGFLRGALADPAVSAQPGAKTPFDAVIDAQQRAQSENWSAEKMTATLLSIAEQSGASNREMEGVQVVRMAQSVSQVLAVEWSSLFAWLTAVLYNDEGTNQFDAKNYAQAMKAYALSALMFLQANLPGRATEMLELGANLVTRSASQMADFVTDFGIVLPELERQGGNPVVAKVRDLGRMFMPLAAEDGKLSSLTLQLAGMLKGVLLTAARRAGGSLQWIDSEQSRGLLKRIEEVRSEAPLGGLVQDIGGLTQDELLTVFAEETELAPGEGPDSTLHNLEAGYDREVRRRSRRPAQQSEPLPSFQDTTAALGPETALIDYYSGTLPNGNAGLYVHVLSRDSAAGTLIDFKLPGMQVALGTGGFQADLLSLSVAELRSALRRAPEQGDLALEARKALDLCPYVAGPVAEILRHLREQGKWHLCVVPHGPLHFLPFHLLPYGDGLLGDEWAVTYLPALGLLEPGRPKPAARASQIASFGIEFKNGEPHGLEEIPGSEEEARVVGSTFGEKALTGEAATESALHAALATAQRVHLSTHGFLPVSAPSFQRVYLMPDDVSDGILYAWELLRHDLSGLDLLTLSACETALGRVDKGDNLRSLAANALIAGANTVIGTLWPVRSGVTRTFFQAFYREMAGGAGKREAFQTAQLTARQQYPEFRDWGAFWYTGLW